MSEEKCKNCWWNDFDGVGIDICYSPQFRDPENFCGPHISQVAWECNSYRSKVKCRDCEHCKKDKDGDLICEYDSIPDEGNISTVYVIREPDALHTCDVFEEREAR
jgi:hypothetical protein